MEKRWERDIPAYKSLRAQGYQPPCIDGSADLAATAQTDSDIEVGRPMGKEFHEAKTDLAS